LTICQAPRPTDGFWYCFTTCLQPEASGCTSLGVRSGSLVITVRTFLLIYCQKMGEPRLGGLSLNILPILETATVKESIFGGCGWTGCGYTNRRLTRRLWSCSGRLGSAEFDICHV